MIMIMIIINKQTNKLLTVSSGFFIGHVENVKAAGRFIQSGASTT